MEQKEPIRPGRTEVAPIRLLVLDIDGTIADEAGYIRDSVAQAIHSAQRRGVAVAIATGRGFQLSLPAHDSIGSSLPLICYEGALVKEPNTGCLHRHWFLARRAAEQVLHHTEQLSLSGRLSVHFHVDDTLYVSNLNSAAIKYFEGSEIEPIVVSDLRPKLNRAITKVRVVSDDAGLITWLYNQLQNAHGRTRLKQYKSLTFLEVDHPAVNKRLAVSYLAENFMGLLPENVMAIGDNFSDIEMLQYAGTGVAMGNAPMAVKAFSDWVTTTIEEDGVARAIEQWILRARFSAEPALRIVSSKRTHQARAR